MPAAAVIPAPRAYTNIAAVKALVVGYWAAGLLGGRWPQGRSACLRTCTGPRRLLELNPRQYVPAPAFLMVRTLAPAQRPLQWDPRRLHSRCMSGRSESLVPAIRLGPPPESTIVATLDNSVCLKRPVLAGCSSMELRSIDRMFGNRVVLALAPVLDNVGLSPVLGRYAIGFVCGRPGLGAVQGSFRPQMMEMLRVRAIATPEVKFLDRCKSNRSEGVMQVHVRRSRMRVWVAKMIRHRRSPRQSTMPAQSG